MKVCPPFAVMIVRGNCSSTSSTTSAVDLLPLLNSVRGMNMLDGTTPPLGMRGHYIDTKPGHRRMSAVGSNQNKAITKRLASAGHYQNVRRRPLCSDVHCPLALACIFGECRTESQAFGEVMLQCRATHSAHSLGTD